MKNGFGIDEDAYKKIFAKNLRDWMYARDITQKGLADKLGVSPTIVSAWCRGEKSPRMTKVDAICKVLNINRSDLMLDKNEAPAPTDEDLALAQKIARLDPYRRKLIESIINTDPDK